MRIKTVPHGYWTWTGQMMSKESPNHKTPISVQVLARKNKVFEKLLGAKWSHSQYLPIPESQFSFSFPNNYNRRVDPKSGCIKPLSNAFGQQPPPRSRESTAVPAPPRQFWKRPGTPERPPKIIKDPIPGGIRGHPNGYKSTPK